MKTYHGSFVRLNHLAGVFAFFGFVASLPAEPLELISWNLESGESSMQWVADKIGQRGGVELWGLSEVPSSARSVIEAAAEEGENADFGSVLGTTGREDRLMVVYSTARFDFLDHEELHDINIGGRVRAPLVVRLRDKPTGQEFFFMVNHLYRGNNAGRHEQATRINAWAAQQTIPVITVGDFNFDWEVNGGEGNHDRGYDNLVANGVFKWVRPAVLVRTQFGSSYNSVLDFVFVSNHGLHWPAESSIIQEPDDEPDDAIKSDHRPVWARITLAASTPPAPPSVPLSPRDEEILNRLNAIETEVRELKKIIQPTPDA